MDLYLMYLRKSRMDSDYEEESVEETLKRHEKILTEFAEKNNFFVEEVFKEVVSGESIAERPEIQKVLAKVSTNKYKGVITIDIDRLSRGDSIDSGYITQVFMYGNCKIVTPAKIYDLSNESDEQFTDMKFLFSRYELKAIKNRLVRGRYSSAGEGKYLGADAPYGYEIEKIKGDKGNTLKINPQEAEIIKMIYNCYINEGMGYRAIAIKLDDLGIKPRNAKSWSVAVIRTMIQNPVYCGKIRYSYKRAVKKMVDGKVKKVREYDSNAPIYQGLHEPIISEEQWNKAQEMSVLNNKFPVKHSTELRNVFAGILYCKNCGHKIARTISGGRTSRMNCSNLHCKMPSAYYEVVEKNILRALTEWLENYELNLKKPEQTINISPLKTALSNLEKEIEKLSLQQQKACEMLEQGIYSIEMFQKRNSALDAQIKELHSQKNNIVVKIEDYKNKKDSKNSVPKVLKGLLKNYETLTAEEKNRMLKIIVKRIEYYKDSNTKELKIDIFPVI